jgi:endoglucanase
MSLPAEPWRSQHLDWLLEITQIPTAAGREWRVVEWIRRWVDERPDVALTVDGAGNLVIAPRALWGSGGSGGSPVFVTAHLDHPAFVVDRVVAPTVLELAFRGGVMDVYFDKARVAVHTGGREGRAAGVLRGTLAGVASPAGALFTTYLCELDAEGGSGPVDARKQVGVGDVCVWDLPPAEVDAQGVVHTHACDDLAALSAALSAFDVLRSVNASGKRTEDVRLIFTRSEEIGFTGAIAACKLGTIPRGARVIALENSRSFAESPIGGGPIVRVGDRMSVFDPRLTAACAKRAEEISGNAAAPTASQKNSDLAGWRWQRKLMAGGACEATVFCAYGYQATCLCLPLGNYHNMADLGAVQEGTYDAARLGPPRTAREFIHSRDYHGLVDLLVAIGERLPEGDPALARIEKLYDTRAFVLDER